MVASRAPRGIDWTSENNLLRYRPVAQALHLVAEGVNLEQPLPAREEIQNWSDVYNDVPFHPLAPLVHVLVLQPIGPHSRTLVFLHGRDGTALQYAIANQAGWEDHRRRGTKIILPNAPLQWDVERLRFCWLRSGKNNPAISEVVEASNSLFCLIQVEASEIGPLNLCVGGYSQGGMMAIHVGLSMGVGSINGVVALNAWVLSCTLSTMVVKSRHPKLMSFNGDADVCVDPIRAQASYDGLSVARIDHPTRDIKHAIQPSVFRKVIRCALAELFPYP